MNDYPRFKRELELAGWFNGDSEYYGMVGQAVMELVDVLMGQGASVGLVATLFCKLISGEVLTPLNGTPDEWVEVSTYTKNEDRYINVRMPNVFADGENGECAYFLDGRVFVRRDGSSFICPESITPLKFPCTPTTVYIYEGTPEAEQFKHVFIKEG